MSGDFWLIILVLVWKTWSCIIHPNALFGEAQGKIKSFIVNISKLQIFIFGPFRCGKSTLVCNLLKNNFYQKPFAEVILCVPKSSQQLVGETISSYKASCQDIHLTVHHGLLSPSDLPYRDLSEPRLIIYEDMFDLIVESQEMSLFFTFTSRQTWDLFKNCRLGTDFMQSLGLVSQLAFLTNS